MPIHPDIKTHYGRYWSANLEAEAPDGHVSLLYLWNQQDVDRLVENLIGHAVACRQNRTPFSVFFACTEPESDLFLTLNNSTLSGGTADDGGLQYVRVRIDHRLDLGGIDIEAGPQDQVLEPPDQMNLSIVVEKSEIPHR